ncbi:MAG: STAS domain-containing protein [Clostridium sp.]|jgi:anti-sigma B factor antagonist|nr:STAS domain-containing protein [Clostridium sp.]
MKIEEIRNQENLDVKLHGRLDTVTAPELEKRMEGSLDGITKLRMDFQDLEYVSSAGLRVLLALSKKMNGGMVVCKVNEEVMEVFRITGFTNVLVIET